MRRALSVLPLLAVLAALSCEGRELTVFDLPDKAGSAGMSGDAALMKVGDGFGGGGASMAGSGGGGSLVAGAPGPEVGGRGGAGGAAAVAGTAGTGGSDEMMPCGNDMDCSPGWLCEKQGCDATSGLCEPRPVFCSSDPMPVCGCDGVTYWNDCIRRQAGAQVAAPDQCRSTACTCEVGADCKVPNASCSHLVAPGEMCGHGRGACWVLPPQCTDSLMWRECQPPDLPPGPCVDTCTAIASEKSFARARKDMPCN